MRILYLTNESAEFRNVVPEALRSQGFRVKVNTKQLPVGVTPPTDLIISDRYSHKISASICEEFSNASLNLHSSFLPKFRGSYPILFSLLAGEVPGWTIHRIGEAIDSGEILFQKYISICLSTDTLKTVWLRCQLEMITYIASNLSQFIQHGRFADFKPIPSPTAGSFHYRQEFSLASNLLTNGWNTPISSLYGHGKG